MSLSLPAFFDILIGITFIYLILSLLASEIQELIAAFLQFRAKHLKKSIYIMLGGPDNSKEVEQSLKGLNESKVSTPQKSDKEKAINLTNKLYENSLIASLTQSNLGFSRNDGLTKLLYGPSYIPSETFASALLDILQPILKVDEENNIFSQVELECNPFDKIETIPTKLKHNLYELAMRAKLKAKNSNQKELETYQFKKEIEKWYDRSQNRTSGTYKRNTKFLLFWIALITAVFANANAFHIVSSLYHQSTVRNAVTQAAVNAVDNCKEVSDDKKTACFDTLDTKIKETLKADQLPLGWKTQEHFIESFNLSNRANILNLLGWIMSAFAIMMNAPFWFDLLNKFVNVRNAGPKPPSSTES
ncbi:hypothetical protein [Coleofasciculus sp. FACHB-T130]|uniref:hypothetical protein n=1 Tax=Cyanophyceae TaxID=3028117 RepID=UPI00168910BD|nr:hypothetical protein [Coleofasciculus sp. FACHB-T130]MBD1879548.1 hypothetical protein [Coleofasciculus sp. FACHB-T130]